ncbi:MAG: hypothetical protein KF832_06750 [Caldilineaceae bacterium]|nr:hypothetical protein [Caldilineaceae bacterium]
MMWNLFRKIVAVVVTGLLASAVYAGVINAVGTSLLTTVKPTLENVRDYAPAPTAAAVAYAVDGGWLFAGQPNHWVQRPTPPNVIVGAVAVDPTNLQKVYIGAANEMAVYWSDDGANTWRRVPLTDQYIGGVTDVAFNSAQRTLYIATDTAGIFRLRDVGSSMIAGGHTYLDQPVLEIVSDQGGAGLVFARTEWQVYRAMNNGLQWLALDTLTSAPTALAITNDELATVYLGTIDHGLLRSQDGFNWTIVKPSFSQEAGIRLRIDALAADPMQPGLLYVASSYLFGHSEVHQAPAGVAMSVDNGAHWSPVAATLAAPVARLLPVSGLEGAVYALTNLSRTPQPLGNAPAVDSTLAVATELPVSIAGWFYRVLVGTATSVTTLLLVWLVLVELRKRISGVRNLPLPKIVERMMQGV